MFCLYRKRLQLVLANRRNAGDFCTNLLFLKSFSSIAVSKTSIEAAADDKQKQKHSFIVSYLINTCGLSSETAKYVSNKVHFETPERSDSLINLLKNHGFTNTHISKLVKKTPRLLKASKPEKTLLPKLEFLQSIGVSVSDLPSIISRNPALLTRSLNNHLIPMYNVFKSVFVVDVEENFVKTLKLSSWIGWNHMNNKNAAANVSVLRRHGVPQSSLSLSVTRYPKSLCLNTQKLAEDVKKIIGMGFNPLTPTFLDGLQVLGQMSKSTWRHKIEVYRRWGWSKDEILLAFKKHPICMRTSEKKIISVMDFLVNKMGWQPAGVARVPVVFCYSLEKRIILRCSVIRLLRLMGLINGETALSSVVVASEKHFINSFVIKYQAHKAQLLKIFQGKMSLVELGFGFEEKSGAKHL